MYTEIMGLSSDMARCWRRLRRLFVWTNITACEHKLMVPVDVRILFLRRRSAKSFARRMIISTRYSTTTQQSNTVSLPCDCQRIRTVLLSTSVRLSVCLSVCQTRGLWQKRNNSLSIFQHRTIYSHVSSFLRPNFVILLLGLHPERMCQRGVPICRKRKCDQ